MVRKMIALRLGRPVNEPLQFSYAYRRIIYLWGTMAVVGLIFIALYRHQLAEIMHGLESDVFGFAANLSIGGCISPIVTGVQKARDSNLTDI